MRMSWCKRCPQEGPWAAESSSRPGAIQGMNPARAEGLAAHFSQCQGADALGTVAGWESTCSPANPREILEFKGTCKAGSLSWALVDLHRLNIWCSYCI